ncbi:hypothetical protein BDZ91DRAFT_151961 [Kalaharituber pfeilii]|nr:hypothetical protein BDZ91DRAFT_151961 [Kalaharituber pfeilii]
MSAVFLREHARRIRKEQIECSFDCILRSLSLQAGLRAYKEAILHPRATQARLNLKGRMIECKPYIAYYRIASIPTSLIQITALSSLAVLRSVKEQS